MEGSGVCSNRKPNQSRTMLSAAPIHPPTSPQRIPSITRPTIPNVRRLGLRRGGIKPPPPPPPPQPVQGPPRAGWHTAVGAPHARHIRRPPAAGRRRKLGRVRRGGERRVRRSRGRGGVVELRGLEGRRARGVVGPVARVGVAP